MDSNKNNASGSQVWHTDTDPNSDTEKRKKRKKEKRRKKKRNKRETG